MKAIVIALIALCISTPVLAKSPVKCININEVSNTQDPMALTRSMLQCVEEKRFADAADLYNFTEVYANYDTRRVSDRKAHEVYGLIKIQAMKVLDEHHWLKFEKALQQRSAATDYKKRLCAAAQSAGAPTYSPDYMTTWPGVNGSLNPDFKPKKAWSDVLKSHLKCE